jgi:hypothetical protein
VSEDKDTTLGGLGLPQYFHPNESELLRQSLVDLLGNFASDLQKEDLRAKVVALVPAFQKLRDLGRSLIPQSDVDSGRDRILAYLRRYPQQAIDSDELIVVSGIPEWARRVGELREKFGWWIQRGETFVDIARAAAEAGDRAELDDVTALDIGPHQYILTREQEDRDAAYRWNVLREIRQRKVSAKAKLVEYFRRNVRRQITGEELKYLGDGARNWARRVRELRTQAGWPILTKHSGEADLALGVYVLAEDQCIERVAQCVRPFDNETTRCSHGFRESSWNDITRKRNPRC